MTRSASLLYLWLWGPILLGLGVGGLVLHPDFATGRDVTHDHLFGVFETNGWHSLAGLVFGLACVGVAALAPRHAPRTALAVGLFGGVLPTVPFLIAGDGGVVFGLIPVDFTDTLTLHLLPGLVGVACATAPIERWRAGSTTGQRRASITSSTPTATRSP